MYYLYLINTSYNFYEFHLFDKLQSHLSNSHHFIIPLHYTDFSISIENINDNSNINNNSNINDNSYYLFISYFNYKISIAEFPNINIHFFINKIFKPIVKINPNNLYLNFLDIGRGY